MFKKDFATSDENTTRNESINDVIGNKDDHSFSDVVGSGLKPSVIGHLKAGYFHVHASAKLYPSLAPPVELTAGGASWTLGTIVEIVPANGITSVFDIHFVKINEISASTYYELVLYKGASTEEVEIGRIGFYRGTSQLLSQQDNPIQIPPQPANTRISAALASGAGASETVNVKVFYHEYPDVT